ncbi:putative germin-like protein 2-1 [Aristolochia californica]|uniref:putative germin-like protein 2-1 n=1 Tax=Aristolochia californica TaxID=171875 RepID=UPI0035DA7280
MAIGSLLLGFIVLSSSLAFAFEPHPLQDFCVADSSSQVLLNGVACKDPKLVQADHFFFSGLHLAGNTSNQLGSAVTPATVAQIAGLNTLGISVVRLDIASGGVIPPHFHPRATEILTVLDGALTVAFITSNPENRLISKTLNKGDVFVFPIGLIHYQYNSGHSHAVAFAALSSQNPGIITVADAVFGSNRPISDDLLTKAFQVDKNVVDYLQAQFWKN